MAGVQLNASTLKTLATLLGGQDEGNGGKGNRSREPWATIVTGVEFPVSKGPNARIERFDLRQTPAGEAMVTLVQTGGWQNNAVSKTAFACTAEAAAALRAAADLIDNVLSGKLQIPAINRQNQGQAQGGQAQGGQAQAAAPVDVEAIVKAQVTAMEERLMAAIAATKAPKGRKDDTAAGRAAQ